MKFPSFFILKSHLGGKMTVVACAGTKVVPSYLLELHYPLSSTRFICFAVLPNDLGRRAAVQLQDRN